MAAARNTSFDNFKPDKYFDERRDLLSILLPKIDMKIFYCWGNGGLTNGSSCLPVFKKKSRPLRHFSFWASSAKPLTQHCHVGSSLDNGPVGPND